MWACFCLNLFAASPFVTLAVARAHQNKARVFLNYVQFTFKIRWPASTRQAPHAQVICRWSQVNLPEVEGNSQLSFSILFFLFVPLSIANCLYQTQFRKSRKFPTKGRFCALSIHSIHIFFKKKGRRSPQFEIVVWNNTTFEAFESVLFWEKLSH